MGRKERRSGGMRDKAQRKAERAGNRGGSNYLNLPDGIGFYKVKKGTRALDVLPYTVSVDNHPEMEKGGEWYQRTIWVHYNIGPEDKAVLCPKTFKKRCPICEHVAQMKKDPDADPKTIQDIKAKERELYNVIDIEEGGDEVLLFEYSYHNFGKRLDEEIREAKPDKDPHPADFAEIEGGSTLQVRFGEVSIGVGKPFLQASRIDFEERDDYDEDILDKVVDLDTVLKPMSYQALEELFYETGSGDDEEKEEKEEGKSSRRSKKDDEEPEEKEEKKSSRRSRKDDDDEPEEKPEEKEEKKSSRGSKEKEEPEEEPEEKKEEGECPTGHAFGEDVDTDDDCESCPKLTWSKCMDRYEEIRAEKKKKSK